MATSTPVMPMGKRMVMDFEDPVLFNRVQFYAYMNLTLSLAIAAASYWTSHILSTRTKQQASNKTIFLARLSHEIRTPLVSIIGAWDIMKERIRKLSDDEQNAASTIEVSCENLRQLVNDVRHAIASETKWIL
jgi:signal transduction histidine kinase